MKTPDRFDRMLLAAAMPRVVNVPPAVPLPLPVLPVPVASAYITSKRGPRYVDHTACPLCGVTELGIEYHGQLMSGAKVHQLYAHTAGKRLVLRGLSRCLGSGVRVVFEGGVWKGAPTT